VDVAECRLRHHRRYSLAACHCRWPSTPKPPCVCSRMNIFKSKSKLCYDRRSVGQSALISGHPVEPTTNFSSFPQKLSADICDFQYGVPSLTRGRVCNLLMQFLLGIVSAVTLGSKSRGTRDHISLSHLRLGPFIVPSYDSQGYDGNIPSRLHAG
jgi:hypothetical protein